MSTSIVPHISFSASLGRRLADGPPPPHALVHAGFTPRWFRQHVTLDYGPAWHADPRLRQRTMVEMGRALNRRFPELRLGGEPERQVGSISQVQTCAFMAALFGQEIVYAADGWPANRGTPLDDAAVDALAVPAFRRHPVFEDLLRQMALIAADWGRIEGELNYQGVLNTAFRLRGEQLFVDMIQAPARAHHLLDVVVDTMLAVTGAVRGVQAASGVCRDAFVTANCVVNMISPEHYREFVQPRDRRLAAAFRDFGVHNCAWNVDPYAAAYAELRELDYLDFGLESDLARLRRLFPNTTLTAMISPVHLATAAPAVLRRDLERLRRELGACRIVAADIDADVPDARVVEFFRAVADVWAVPPAALVPPPVPW